MTTARRVFSCLGCLLQHSRLLRLSHAAGQRRWQAGEACGLSTLFRKAVPQAVEILAVDAAEVAGERGVAQDGGAQH